MNKFGFKVIKVCFLTLSVFLAIHITAQTTTPTRQLNYQLSWDGLSSRLEVDLSYHNAGRDSSSFVYGNPTPGGLTTIFEIISNLRADMGDSVLIYPELRRITILHRQKGIRKLHYELDGKLAADPRRARPNEAFRPTIEPGFFYSLGYNLYLQPQDSGYNNIGVVWRQWPVGMPYFVSTNPKAPPDQLQVVPIEKSNSLLIQMNQNLVVKNYEVNNIPNYLITSKADTVNDMQEQMKPLLTTLIPQLRKFWNDYDFDFYFVSMIPLLNKVSSTMTGIGLINGFGTRYSGELNKDKIAVIAHEISHTWIGVRLNYASKGMENEWFDEGFNDYIAIQNLLQTGIFTSEDFVNYTNNDILAQYYKNPLNTLPGDSIESKFWQSRDAEKIPYHRGYIYAFYLDHQIQVKSKNQYSIRDFLTILYTNSKTSNKSTITNDEFVTAIEKFLPKKQVLQEIQHYMLDGNLMDLSTIPLSEGFKIQYNDKIPVLTVNN